MGKEGFDPLSAKSGHSPRNSKRGPNDGTSPVKQKGFRAGYSARTVSKENDSFGSGCSKQGGFLSF